MGKQKSEKLIERDKQLMIKYDEIVRSYGPEIRRISKGSIYDEVGDCFFISGERARVIISENLKKGNEEDRLR